MTSTPQSLTDLIRSIVKNKGIYAVNEQRTKNGVVHPLLACLGWDPCNMQEVDPEYAVGSGRVDYCLKRGEVAAGIDRPVNIGASCKHREFEASATDVETDETHVHIAQYPAATLDVAVARLGHRERQIAAKHRVRVGHGTGKDMGRLLRHDSWVVAGPVQDQQQ